MRTIFISDIHLNEQRPDITQALLNFLNTTAANCDQLYLLGDIFDAWIGDDYIPPNLTPIINRLTKLSQQGIELYFQHGNRDFLIGQDFANLTQSTLLPEQIVITLPDGQKALILHGDQLCTDDTDYQVFRTMVRDPAWQHNFLAKTLEERLAIAQQLRATSKEKIAEKAQDITDVNQASVKTAMQHANCQLLIHGHTHRPNIHQQQTGVADGTRIVLGDWDRELWYLDCNTNGYELLKEPIPNSQTKT